MAPKPKWSDTDAKGLTWIYNYVKSLPGYADARKEDFMYTYNKKLLGIISKNTKNKAIVTAIIGVVPQPGATLPYSAFNGRRISPNLVLKAILN